MGSEMVRVLLMVAVLVWPMVGAADYDEGFAAFERGDYETAFREWLPLAEAGNATAQYNLGLLYDKGQGVPQDDQEALRWWRKAAEQGLAEAQAAFIFAPNCGALCRPYSRSPPLAYWWRLDLGLCERL